MKNYSNRPWLPASAFLAIAVAVPAMNAQEGGPGGTARITNTPAPTSPVSGNATSGKKLYYSYGCYACHGYNGETGARAFVGHWGHLATEQDFVTFLRGRANVAPVVPSGSMPNFSEGVLPDQKAKDVYAYIRTFKSSAPETKTIPTLNAIVEASKQGTK
jgi:mono/diheme cytochrome c family protein